MRNGLLLNRLRGTHDKHKKTHSDIIKIPSDSHSTATDTTRPQAARPRKNTYRHPTPKVEMAGSSSIYDRLEGGLGPQRGPIGRHNWKKYAIIAGLVIGLLWFAAPQSESYLWNKDKGALLITTQVECKFTENVKACQLRPMTMT
jgi:guanosine-diphosphatase